MGIGIEGDATPRSQLPFDVPSPTIAKLGGGNITLTKGGDEDPDQQRGPRFAILVWK